MVKIEAFIHSFKLDAVKAALDEIGVRGPVYSHALCHAAGDTPKLHYRGATYSADVPVLRLEMLVSSLQVDEVIEALHLAARTNESANDGLILVYEVANAIQINNGERADFALY